MGAEAPQKHGAERKTHPLLFLLLLFVTQDDPELLILLAHPSSRAGIIDVHLLSQLRVWPL